MAAFLFYDASALCKRFVAEDGTLLVQQLSQAVPSSHQGCFRLGLLELFSILIRRKNDGRLSVEQFELTMQAIKTALVDDAEFKVFNLLEELWEHGHKLLFKYGINASDSLILASALHRAEEARLQNITLILLGSDKRLNRAAQQEGLRVFDPEVDSWESIASLFTQE